MDLITLSLAKGYANKVAAGFKRVEVQGSNLVFTLNDDSKATVAIPTPADGKDGVSVIDLSIDNDGSLLCHMSDGTTIDAGYVPTVDPDLTNYYTKEEIDEGFSGIRKLKFEEPNNMSNYYNYWLYSGECGDFSPIFNNNEPLEVIWDGVSYTLQYNGDMTWGYLDIGPCYISLINERINTTDTSEYHSVIIKDIRGNIILGDLISSEFIDLNNYATKEYVNGKFPVSWNDVLDRPGMYDEEETITLLENAEITVTMIDNGRGYVREESNIKNVFANTTMKYNVNYIVVFDGVTYYKPTYFNTPMPAYHSALGNEYLYTNSSYSDNTGEPFAFDEYGTFYCVADQPGTHTLSIYELTGNIITVKIPEKYLPISETKTLEEQGIFFIELPQNVYFWGSQTFSDEEMINLFQPVVNYLKSLEETGKNQALIVLRRTGIFVGIFSLDNSSYNYSYKMGSIAFTSIGILPEYYGLTAPARNGSFTIITDGTEKVIRVDFNRGSQILMQDNTVAYSVSNNYTPAHKKYVDDSIAAIPTAEQDVYVLVPSNPDDLTFFRDNTGVSNDLYHNVGTDIGDLRGQLKTILQKAYDKGVDKYSIVLHIDSNDIVFGPSAMISKKPTSLILSSQFIQQYGNSFKNAWLRKIKINITLTWNEDVIETVTTSLSANDSRLLTGDNETAYTPTSDYHPATKKYVDDAIGDISTILSTLTTVSEVSE